MPGLVERGRHPLRSVFKEAHAIRLFPAVCRVSHADERLTSRVVDTFRSVVPCAGIRTRSDWFVTSDAPCPLFVPVQRTGRSSVRVPPSVAPKRHG
jgi:hypothetical protein